jgi:glyoxylase-like metal-dependent hydrolase (beta-lactamase superfamily II)
MQVKYILLTHGHLDHCGQARNLANRINVPIYGPHKEDIFWLDQLEQRQKQYASGNYVFEETKNFTPDNWLDEGQQLSLGEHIIDIIHTPGHTPGHIVFHINKLKIAWVGDMIFKHAVGRSDFPRGNTQDLMHSIVKKLLVLGDDYTFICGHGDISTFGHERKYNPYIQGYLD